VTKGSEGRKRKLGPSSYCSGSSLWYCIFLGQSQPNLN